MGNSHSCNLCGWIGRRFASDSWHPFTVCPKCSSQVRHRLLWAILGNESGRKEFALIQNKDILHIAPDNCLKNRVSQEARTYTTADYLAEGYSYDALDFNIDISSMPQIRSESYDCIIALDVLEHVEDDIKAMIEIRRVLRPDGVAIFMIPQKDGLQVTDEDPSVKSPEEREIRFGQFDHLRLYGSDFIERLGSTGLRPEIADENSLSSEVVSYHVLFPPVKSSHPLATNYRKVYFGFK